MNDLRPGRVHNKVYKKGACKVYPIVHCCSVVHCCTLLYTVIHCCTLYKHQQFVFELNHHRLTAGLVRPTCDADGRLPYLVRYCAQNMLLKLGKKNRRFSNICKLFSFLVKPNIVKDSFTTTLYLLDFNGFLPTFGLFHYAKLPSYKRMR